MSQVSSSQLCESFSEEDFIHLFSSFHIKTPQKKKFISIDSEQQIVEHAQNIIAEINQCSLSLFNPHYKINTIDLKATSREHELFLSALKEGASVQHASIDKGEVRSLSLFPQATCEEKDGIKHIQYGAVAKDEVHQTFPDGSWKGIRTNHTNMKMSGLFNASNQLMWGKMEILEQNTPNYFGNSGDCLLTPNPFPQKDALCIFKTVDFEQPSTFLTVKMLDMGRSVAVEEEIKVIFDAIIQNRKVLTQKEKVLADEILTSLKYADNEKGVYQWKLDAIAISRSPSPL